ncbi:MAG TPA: hypothetical protein VFO34_11540 [Candidatus Acidoferrales bacterium]|nr:hypothetical protein [Candidatus Acidoferrales bacterium]
MFRICASFIAVSLAAVFPLVPVRGPLESVKTIRLEPTVISNPDKVKVDGASALVQDNLRDALRSANFEIGDSRVRAHIELNEFTAGSTAERVLFGTYGLGRSYLDSRLVISDGDKQLANVRIHVRGNFSMSGFEGGKTQSRQAENRFQKRLLQELNKLK